MKHPTKKLKTCSRGHTYRGSAPCPKCWPASARRSELQRGKPGYYKKRGTAAHAK